jgi:hypothetical protein
VERRISPGAVVVLDDVLPGQPEMLQRDRKFNAWCGDVYKVIRLLRRRGLLDETVLEDAAADEPALTDLLAESVAFPRARIVDPGRARPATDPASLGSVAGFNLHAGVALSALGRERLCRRIDHPFPTTA